MIKSWFQERCLFKRNYRNLHEEVYYFSCCQYPNLLCVLSHLWYSFLHSSVLLFLVKQAAKSTFKSGDFCKRQREQSVHTLRPRPPGVAERWSRYIESCQRRGVRVEPLNPPAGLISAWWGREYQVPTRKQVAAQHVGNFMLIEYFEIEKKKKKQVKKIILFLLYGV